MVTLLDVCLSLYNSGYYLALFITPWILYCLTFYKDWFYYVKLFFAKRTINKLKKSCKFQKKSGEKLENVIDIPTTKHSNTQIIHGADQKGNTLTIRFVLHFQKIAEIYLCLKLANGQKYKLPGDEFINFYSLAQRQWKVNGLNIEVLEPFKKLRITFNGLLENADNKIEHVQFNFIWNAAGKPAHFPADAETQLLSEALAKEHWRDGDWIKFLPDSSSFDQFGVLIGFAKIESDKKEHILHLPSCRTKYKGIKDNLLLNRELRIFLVAQDGTLLNLHVKSLEKGCSQLCYGHVKFSDGTLSPVTGTDIVLRDIATIPSILSAHITANRKVFRCIFHLNKNHGNKIINNDTKGYEVHSVPFETDFGSQQAVGIVEFWYQRTGTGITLPPALLSPKDVTNLPKKFVTNIQNEDAQILEITGGKGNSLALLASLQSNKFIIPNGFIVTVNAFKEQLSSNLKLKKSIEVIDEICCGRENGKLEEACDETIKLFKQEEILSKIELEIKAEIKNTKNVKTKDGIVDFRWAVRSSAIGEDSEELSAAGQNETILGCETDEDILEAVKACWASLFTFQSVQYRWQHGLSVQSDMAVVVQKMVPADAAGVLFTCHPATSNPSQMVITANYGLGESVVSAKSDPDTIILSKKPDGKIKLIKKTIGNKETMVVMNKKTNGVEEVDLGNDKSETLCISDKQIKILAKIGMVLETLFGNARDIEWAFYNGHLYLLQSRPVTTLNSWTDYELLHEFDAPVMSDENVFTVANAGEVFPGALSVLSQTTILVLIDKALQLSTLEEYDAYECRNLTTIQHHAIINVINSIHKNANEAIAMSSKILDLAIFGHPIINEKLNKIALNRFGKFTGLKAVREIVRNVNFARKTKGNLKKMKAEIKNFTLEFNKRDTLLDIYKKIDKSVDTLGNIAQTHCKASAASVFYQIIAMNVLVEKNTDFIADHYTDFATILSSCQNVVSAEVPEILEKVSRLIQNRNLFEEFAKIDAKDGVEWLKKNCPDAGEEFEKFLQKHGHRLLREFELKEETWGMNPSKVIKMIQANSGMVKKEKPKEENVDEVVKKLISPKSNITRKILKFVINKMRIAVGDRETAKSELIKGVNTIRIAYRHLAKEMVLQGILPREDLIYHLSHHEVGQLLEQRNPILVSKAMRRQRLYPQWDKMRFKEVMYGVPEPEKTKQIIHKNSKISISGTSVCTGDVTARACVITNLDEIHLLTTGDILITYSTDIGWSPYFPMLSGVVTELGGLVSHGTVVAREYGLPCIVGVRNVTKYFQTGDVVQLSGKSGKLELVSRC